jgi:hypothetical protein
MLLGRTLLMDVFSIITLGYIVYDYTTIFRVYEKGGVLIQLHHTAEALITVGYGFFPVSAAYIAAGGLMQLSSGILHIQRILSIHGVALPATLASLLKWSLILTWLHSRLIAFVIVMVNNFMHFPMTLFHVFLLIAGGALTYLSFPNTYNN